MLQAACEPNVYHGEEDGDDPLENAGSVQPAIQQYLKQTLRNPYSNPKYESTAWPHFLL